MLTISLFYEQSHIISHSQGLTNGLSDRDYRVLTISLFYEQSHIIAHSQGLTNGLSDRDYRVLTISLFYVQNKYITTWNIKNDKKYLKIKNKTKTKYV